MRAFLHSTISAAVAVVIAVQSSAAGAAQSITPEEWSLYKQRFMDPAGRIIDNANGNITHSEGQGYGLLLSYLADSRGDFESIWAFTRTEMMLRNDGLSVWKWDPNTKPHVSDINNATDGDLLIAYAATLAANAWRRPDLSSAALAMAESLAAHGAENIGGVLLLRPGNQGFDAKSRRDGPVVNPSYFVFEALQALQEIQPDGPWSQLSDGGLKLVVASLAIGRAGLPPDWISLAGEPKAAEGFPQEFGYNAVRIPLYLARAGLVDRALLRKIQTNMTNEQGEVRLVAISTGQTIGLLRDPGYRVIPALVDCVLDRKPLPEELRVFTPTDYYPSTLHLLSLSFLRRRHSECL